MEEEAAKLKAMQEQVEKDTPAAATDAGLYLAKALRVILVSNVMPVFLISLSVKEDTDNRSVYVGNVDYTTTPEELQAHFQACGAIDRITFLCDKWTGHPKGFGYVEFADASCVWKLPSPSTNLCSKAVCSRRKTLMSSLSHADDKDIYPPLQVTAKRTNVPSFMRGSFRGAPRGGRAYRGAGGRGFDRGGYRRGRPPYRFLDPYLA
ncbi:Polyadenylate-binding protein 2 [Chytriomyces hyalinus]|nr:Polyadenylate-binding protein 2 [Chytriomyces hyalinus]